MILESWPINKFIEYINNPRINDPAVDRIASAINEFGFKIPVVAKSDGTLVDGHLRLKAARKLNLKEIPVLLADDLTDAQIKAFRISVNQVANLAEWDIELLKIEIEGLEELDFDIDLLGFDDIPSLLNEHDPYSEWEGMPEFKQPDNTSFRHIIVHFDNNDDVNEFFSLIGQGNTDNTKSIWHPEKERECFTDKSYD